MEPHRVNDSATGTRPPIPPVDDDTIRESEDRAFRAWPAEGVIRLSGWAQRYAPGTSTRRTNSVFAGAVDASINLDAMFRQVESFYGNLCQAPRFQITPASFPVDLDKKLAERGYTTEGQSTVAWACAGDVMAKDVDLPDSISVSPEMSDAWADLYIKTISTTDDPKARLSLFNRIKCEKAHVMAEKDGDPVAIGLGVYDEGWTGVFAMYTDPAFRRQGLANSIIGTLADWTDNMGGEYMYLQVEDDNKAAWSVYDQSGFHPVYQYHYRTLSE